MNSLEAYIQFTAEPRSTTRQVTNEKTAEFLRNYMAEFRDFIERVLTVLPREQGND